MSRGDQPVADLMQKRVSTRDKFVPTFRVEPHPALIAHDPVEAHAGRSFDNTGQSERFGNGDHAAPVQEHVDVEEHAHRHAGALGRTRQGFDRSRVVCRDHDVGELRQPGDAGELRLVDHLVGDQHIVDAGGDHDLGLPHRRAGHAHRELAQLTLRQLRGAMGLHMRAHGLSGALQQLVHRVDVGVE